MTTLNILIVQSCRGITHFKSSDRVSITEVRVAGGSDLRSNQHYLRPECPEVTAGDAYKAKSDGQGLMIGVASRKMVRGSINPKKNIWWKRCVGFFNAYKSSLDW